MALGFAGISETGIFQQLANCYSVTQKQITSYDFSTYIGDFTVSKSCSQTGGYGLFNITHENFEQKISSYSLKSPIFDINLNSKQIGISTSINGISSGVSSNGFSVGYEVPTSFNGGRGAASFELEYRPNALGKGLIFAGLCIVQPEFAYLYRFIFQ